MPKSFLDAISYSRPAVDHGVQLRELRRRKENGSRGKSKLEIGSGWLAKHVGGGDEVEQVVDQLEGDPEVFSVEERFVGFLGARLGEHSICLAAVSHQACRLVERLVDVVLKPGEQDSKGFHVLSLSLLIKDALLKKKR